MRERNSEADELKRSETSCTKLIDPRRPVELFERDILRVRSSFYSKHVPVPGLSEAVSIRETSCGRLRQFAFGPSSAVSSRLRKIRDGNFINCSQYTGKILSAALVRYPRRRPCPIDRPPRRRGFQSDCEYCGNHI